MDKKTINEGDRVRVTPRNELAVGRGIGIVTHVGPTGGIVRVKFSHIPAPNGVACFAGDCEVVEEK